VNDHTSRRMIRSVFRPTVAAVALLALALPQALAASERTKTVTISVDAAADRRPISPLIYGLNWATPEQMAAWDHFLRGMWHFNRLTEEESDRAIASPESE